MQNLPNDAGDDGGVTRRPPFVLPGSADEVRAIYESMACGVVVTDASGAVVYANSAAERILGRTREEIAAARDTPIWKVTDAGEEPVASTDQPDLEILRGGPPVHRVRLRIPMPDGTPRWIEVDSVPVMGPDRRPFQVISSFIDVTESHLAAEAVRQTLEREQRRSIQLQALADAALLVTSAATLQTVLQTIADQARQIIDAHYAATCLAIEGDWTQPLTAVSLSRRNERRRTGYEQLDGARIYSFIGRENRAVRLTRADLQSHPVRRWLGEAAAGLPAVRGWLAVPLFDTRSNDRGLIHLTDKERGDFTEDDEAILAQLAQLASVAIANARLHEALQHELAEREVTEAALQESEARFRSHFQNASDVLIVLDETGHIRYSSPSVELALGYGVDENTGRNAFDFIHPDDRQRIVDSFAGVVTHTGPFAPIEFRIRHADGRWRWFEATATNLLHDPNVRGIVENLRDITERHRMEETERFLAELTTRLTGILDYATRLEAVARTTVPFFADCCVVDILVEEGAVRRLAVSCSNPANEPLLRREYQDFMPVLDRRHPIARALRTGRTVVMPVIEEADLEADKPSAAHLDARRTLQLTSLIAAPLVARGRTFGVVAFAQAESGRRFSDADLSLAEEIARRSASALENARLHHELSDHREQLQELVGRLLTAQEEERRRVAYDVHDGLAQVAAATHQQLQSFVAHHAPRGQEARRSLDHVVTLAHQTVREARRVIAGLRPTALDDFGLSAAIQHEMAALRREGWNITYHEDLDGRRLPPPIETTLYRVAQESLSNVRKHAGATHVRIMLTMGEQTARLEVRDWGSGFNRSLPAPTAGGEQVGIAGMRERVKLLNGQFYLHSRPGRGTVVIAIVPLSLHDTASTAAHDTAGQVSRRNG